MWISKEHYTTLNNLINSAQDRSTAMLTRETAALTKLQVTEADNARLRADLEWFKHRLNQVEMERAMLMQDRIGVKIEVPKFVPAIDDPSEALSKVVDISTVGGDAIETDTDADTTQNPGANYHNLPGYRGRR